MIKIIQNFLGFCQKENRNKFIASIVLNVFQAVFEALKIVAIYIFIRAGLESTITGKTAVTCFGFMIVSILGAGFLKNEMTILQTEGGYLTCAKKRMEIAEHLRYVPMGYFNDNSLGQVVSVTTNTMQTLEGLATRVIMMVAGAILNTAVITLLILFFDVRIGFILLIGLVLFGITNHLLMNKSAQMAPKKDKADEVLVTQILEYIEGISEVKSYKLTGEKCARLNAANDINAKINYQMEKAFVPYIGVQTFIIKIIGVAMTFASVYFYIGGTMSLANCIIMIIASFMIYASLEGANGYTSLLRNVDLCVEKAKAILSSEQMELEGSKDIPSSLEIKAEHISFSYEKKKIIDDVSFTIPEKTVTAIVGPSGGGKSTLTNLISRFWDVDEGSITLGGKNLKEYNYDILMKNFSFVFQKVYLFKDTIANNIRFGTPEASMEQVVEAAKKAKCHEFIMALPNGYDTVIGEEGVNLSGGERQRLSIARAIMKDSPIIILDEATSNVDPENERELMEAVDELTKDKTIIMIAHRLKTVEHANQILVVENGKITQSGTHKELLESKGIYREFIQSRQKAVSWKIS